MEDIGNVCIDLTVDPYIAYVALACDYSSLRSCLHLFLCPSSRPFRDLFYHLIILPAFVSRSPFKVLARR